jgi:creatinine amidohydrolase
MSAWKLSDSTYAQVRAQQYQVAVLPLGATEPHNLHLPYGTDTLESDTLGGLVCQRAWQRGAKVVLLPTIPYGTETNQMAFPLAMNLNPSTLSLVISDLVSSLVTHRIYKIILLNSHGGNDLKPVLRELYGKTPARLFLCNWYQMLADRQAEIFDEPGDHAGEMETAFALAYFPDLVGRNPDGSLAADAGEVALSRFEAINRGWVSITRPWHLLTTNAGSGNPHAATADKGRRFVELLVEHLAQFLVELSASPLDERFPY